MYSGTPVTRPIMGPMSDCRVYWGGRVSEVENLWVNFMITYSCQKTAYQYRSIACLHAWLRWCTEAFSWQEQLILRKRLLVIGIVIIELIILSWVMHLGKYLPAAPIQRQYPKAKLTLTSISWLAVQYKMGILRLAFIFCCIRSWMALHVWIKTFFSPCFA
jgi:hypothetical protein